jgi:DNA polymerase V
MKKLEMQKSSIVFKLPLQFADKGVRAGFPSPAQDFLEHSLDFNRDMVKNPESSFYARVVGSSMIDEGINSGDLLLIDRSVEAKNGTLAVCAVDGEFTLKRISKSGDKLYLMPANSNFKPIEIKPEQNFEVWGVVLYIIKKP